MDLIEKISPPSSIQHTFIIVATNYFTKSVEVKPMRAVEHTYVIDFVEETIVHRFGLPETITVDQGLVFMGELFLEYAKKGSMKIIHSILYYAQGNGQDEATNKVIKNVIKKMVKENPREWHDLLSMVPRAIRTSKRLGTGTNPYVLTYDHDAILPMEIIVQLLRVVVQNQLSANEYAQVMLTSWET